MSKEISVGKAKKWTENWRTKFPECKGFVIPVEDLMGVLVEMKVLQQIGEDQYTYDPGYKRDVRGYMGFDPTGGEKGNGEYHFVLLGTQKEINPHPTPNRPFVYKDIYNGGIDGKPGTLEVGSEPNGSGVFDFTHPCPDWCDPDSVLNG